MHVEVNQSGRFASDIAAFLRDFFVAHGFAATITQDQVHVENYPYTLSGAVVRNLENPVGRTVQLDIYFHIGPGQLLVESFAGLGETTEKALESALRNVVTQLSHVLLVAFFDYSDPDTEQETWQINGQTRTISIGHIGVMGLGGNISSPIDENRPWPQEYIDLIRKSDLPPGTHWIRLYYAQQERKPAVFELLLDNEPWQELLPAVTRLPFPPRQEFYSIRLFLVVQGGIGVADALSVICRSDGDDEALFNALVAAGAIPSEAEKYLTLIPLAFGRVLLKALPITLSPRAMLKDTPSTA